MPSGQLEILLAAIDQAFDKKSWHGTNLRGALRGVTHAQASWRPAPARHNIWELTLHAAYWKYAVRRRLLGEPRGSFPHKGSDWFPRPQGKSAADWKQDVRLLVETHRSMRNAIAGLRASDLHYVPAGSTVSNLELVSGIAAHDLYHAGQIQLLKRLGAKGAR
ncbi:MAG: DinB family protein [bacterium]|nr:DinB family protein [bacterium]